MKHVAAHFWTTARDGELHFTGERLRMFRYFVGGCFVNREGPFWVDYRRTGRDVYQSKQCIRITFPRAFQHTSFLFTDLHPFESDKILFCWERQEDIEGKRN